MPRLRATPRSVLLLGPRQVGKSILLMTDRRARLGDVEVLPIREFLAELPP
jgi:predicted AAA+ superfamily ATPase